MTTLTLGSLLLGSADAMVVTVLAAGGLRPATAGAGGDDDLHREAWGGRYIGSRYR